MVAVAEAVRGHEIVEAIRGLASTTSNPNLIVKVIVSTLAETFNGYSVLSIINGDHLDPAAIGTCTSTPDDLARIHTLGKRSVRLDPKNPLVHSLLVDGTPTCVKYGDDDSMLRMRLPRTDEYEAAVALGLRELLLVPIRDHGKTVGAFGVVRYGADAKPFTPREIEIVADVGDIAAAVIKHKNLRVELSAELEVRRTSEARHQLLMDLAREFSATTDDHNGLVALITQRFAELVGEACVMRFKKGGRLEASGHVYHADPAMLARSKELFVDRELVEGQGLAGEVMRAGTAIRAHGPDPETYAQRFGEPVVTWIRELGITSSMSVPLISDGELIAVITLWRTGASRPYTLDEQLLIQNASSHAVLALMNARLFADTQRELAVRRRVENRLRVLSEISRELSTATADWQNVLSLAAQRFGAILGDCCIIRLVENDVLATGTVWHHRQSVIDDIHAAMFTQPQRAGEGIAGRVLQSGTSVVVNSTSEGLASHTQPAFGELILRENITAMMAVPLSTGGRVIGVITMARTMAYSSDDVELMTELATHASLAIHNSRLLDEARRQLETLKKTEDQFRHAQKMEAVGRLAGGIAHDFNNLLTVIVNASSVLLEDIEAPESRADLEDIQGAADRAADLTRQLLAFSRQQVLEPQLIDLNAIVTKTQKMITRVVGEDIDVRVELDPMLFTTKADPGHMNQVLMNLVVNARDAMPEGGTLTIVTRNVGSDVMVAISDTGIGMDEATQTRIFEPFFTTKDKSKGTGLGLSTVFGIVEQSGGRMRVKSKPGCGATFEILLPRTVELPAPSMSGEIRALRGGETILLVEDDAQVRKVATAILQRSGYRVLSAQSGPDALEQYRGRLGEVDMLLSDVIMPAMSGRELADQLVAIRPDLRVLYMSGYTDDAIAHHRVLDEGVVLVAKPFTKASLLERVRHVLARRG